MILYIREKEDRVHYYQVCDIHIEKTCISFHIGEEDITLLKKDIDFASLRTEDGRLLQIIKE